MLLPRTSWCWFRNNAAAAAVEPIHIKVITMAAERRGVTRPGRYTISSLYKSYWWRQKCVCAVRVYMVIESIMWMSMLRFPIKLCNVLLQLGFVPLIFWCAYDARAPPPPRNSPIYLLKLAIFGKENRKMVGLFFFFPPLYYMTSSSLEYIHTHLVVHNNTIDISV